MYRFALLSLLVGLPALTQAGDGATKVGVAKVAITPQQLMWMSGYGARSKPAEGKVHDLWAKAIAIQQGDATLLLITMDLVGIPRDLSQEVCTRIQKQHGLKREQIVLNVSHTHCGPVVGGNLNAMYFLDAAQQKLVDNYAKELSDKLVAVAGDALKNRSLAQVSWGQGYATFGTNRRNNKEGEAAKLRELGLLKGPFDHRVPVLAVRDLQGKLKAVVFGYACHATTLDFYRWCGDYPGFAQLALERIHPGATALFWAGCGADQNPLPRRSLNLAEHYGEELAGAVEAVLRAPLTPLQGPLAATYQEIALPLADLPTREKLVQDSLSKDRYIASRAKLLLKELEKSKELKTTYPYPIQTWRLGKDLAFVALGGEVVVDYALRLSKELGPNVWVAGYSNDVMAYIPSERVLKEGGYEGATSMIYYGMPTVWSPRVEEMIVEAVRGQITKVGAGRSP